MFWSCDELELKRSFSAIQDTLPRERRHLLPQAIVAAALTDAETVPSWIPQWIATEVDMRAIGVPLSLETLLSMQWTLTPVAVADDERAVLYWVLAGLSSSEKIESGFPLWWPLVADETAVRSSDLALKTLRSHTDGDFLFWPLLPFIDRPLVHGPSLGLAFYLAGRGLWTGHVRQGILATGQIRKDGTLPPVGGIARKAAVAFNEGLSGFLYPRSSGAVGEEFDPMETLEAETLEEAGFLWDLHESEQTTRLQYDFHCLQDPERLASNAHLLSDSVLRWKGFESRYSQGIQALLEKKTLAGPLLDSLEREIDQPDYSVWRLQALLAPLHPEKVAEITHRDPLTGFRIAQIQMTNCNRQGRVEESVVWARLGNELLEQIARLEEGWNLKAGHLNREIVLQRHGRYDFRPELPQPLLEAMDALEELDRVKRRLHSETLPVTLGKLHGTVAQNFGFCGPRYLPEVEKYVVLAQQAFGGGRFQNYRTDWQRQFCTLFYALLETGALERARDALEQYLGRSPLSNGADNFEALNPYQHAALARYLAECGQSNPPYAHWCGQHLHDGRSQHPWQLWLYNVGHLMEDRAARREAWLRSVDLCLKLGTTAKPMALLGLSRIEHDGLGNEDLVERKTRQTMQALYSQALSKDHFQRITECATWEAVLREVLASGTRLFPFTYR